VQTKGLVRLRLWVVPYAVFFAYHPVDSLATVAEVRP
jgi:hypothetical protein